MKIYIIKESEMDEKLTLDLGKDSRGFCRIFDFEKPPKGFYELQDQLRNKLELEFKCKFDDNVDRSNYKPWESWIHEFFFFPSDLLNMELIKVELSNQILNDKLLGIILASLEKYSPQYCLLVSVYRGMHKGSEYLGRFVINLKEIAVEDSIGSIWRENIKYMEIDNDASSGIN